MNEFIDKFQHQLHGTLSGFDRLVFRGQLPLIHQAGMRGYLWKEGVPWKEYHHYVRNISLQVKEASLASMRAANRPVEYLCSGKISKEEMARAIARRDGIVSGPVCAFSAVEIDLSWRVVGDRATKKLQLARGMRACTHVYHYWIDPIYGAMSARLQTWFPFTVYVYMNGREWLARQMERVGLRYERHDNCFPWIEDFERAQALMDTQLETEWPQMLGGCLKRVHPLFAELSADYPMQYYWTSFQTEWAMDLVFRSPDVLRRLYPRLIHLGMAGLRSADVMRFMGKKLTRKGDAYGPSHEIITDRKERSEGVRLKHRVGSNSIKIYDKAYSERGAVLRPEITVNDAKQFWVFRQKNGDEEGTLSWRPMRSSIADLHRRAEVSQKALDRYCSALAQVDASTSLKEVAASIERRVRWKGRTVRALHPFAEDDLALLRAVSGGEFAINGLRNRDLQALLYTTPAADKDAARRRSAAVSRKLRLLRAHGIIQKLPHTHRYQVTESGRLVLNAVLTAQHATTQQLTNMAA